VTQPSLYHSEALGIILVIFRNPESRYEANVLIYDDKFPYKQLQKVAIQFDFYMATFSIDRRSIEEQALDSSIFIGLSMTLG
jgi:hypothetical protein